MFSLIKNMTRVSGKNEMIDYNFEELSHQWQTIASILTVPRSEEEYDQLVNFLDRVLDEVEDNENHPLASLVDTIGTLIEAYDNEHYPFSEGNPIESLKYLMEEHNLTQNDLPEIGTQGVVSEILSGKRSLNIRQIYSLSERFNLSPATFL